MPKTFMRTSTGSAWMGAASLWRDTMVYERRRYSSDLRSAHVRSSSLLSPSRLAWSVAGMEDTKSGKVFGNSWFVDVRI